ncbi:MAG: hypothetical protein V4621_04495 [Pseudomonadota bacterium]
MKPVLTCDAPWIAAPALQSVMACLNDNSHLPTAMMVGGAVRDAVRGSMAPPTDIDIATTLLPDHVMGRAAKAGLGVHPTGLAHGTVTLVCDKIPFQVTTLRRDMATDGRHAVVDFTQDWHEDAARRDFTMNTLLMDAAGHVYDPLGTGIDDARQGNIVFVGDPAQRIQEDALRLLRFYRFWATHGHIDRPPTPDVTAALRQSASMLAHLSAERISAEVTKILASDQALFILERMFLNNVLADYPRAADWHKTVAAAIAIPDPAFGTVPLRYWALLPDTDTEMGDKRYLVMTRKLAQQIAAYRDGLTVLQNTDFAPVSLHRCAYHYGAAVTRDLCRMFGRDDRDVPGTIPAFPLRAADVQAVCGASGAALGQILKGAENQWIDSGFTLDRAALLRPLGVRGQGH